MNHGMESDRRQSQGPQGEPGKDGAKGDAGNSLHVANVTVSANSDIATSVLHPNTTFSVGDVVSDVDGVLYSITSIVNTTTVHVGARIDDVTLKGPQGPQGEKGADGTGVNIKGSYDTVEELEAAHPTGESGDAYLVAGSLYVWDVDNKKWTARTASAGHTGMARPPARSPSAACT